ncbi:adenylate isopentenyltransferase 3, chloroplastic [Mercurialis annua]|uniref:adenylate isopentenyltransferase 3, chloroplastic n=1 Tax=Mercurialis annua TaxID=3986 RepID=UPI0021605B3D|nr:adenylate isopentenyltransferase 3, chloroplastic [Mercurialis annua]
MRLSMPFCPQTLHHHHQHQNILDISVNPIWQKPKVVILMGATGTGKSRLSLDLATQFPSEIINSDKMQLYRGLDITTNKITEEQRSGIPHHLLGILDPSSDFTAKDFCNMASLAIGSISTRGLLPIIVGGSNSYIEALVDDPDYRFRSKYDCYFLWIDVSANILQSFLSKRVDEMVSKGMVDEVRKMFDPDADYSKGIRRSIGVPEFDEYFKLLSETYSDEGHGARVLQEAINEVKRNNCKLARRQLGKIRRLKNVKGWNIHRIDANEVFRKHGKEADGAWKKLVERPSIAMVRQFLYSSSPADSSQVAVTSGATKDYLAECFVT